MRWRVRAIENPVRVVGGFVRKAGNAQFFHPVTRLVAFLICQQLRALAVPDTDHEYGDVTRRDETETGGDGDRAHAQPNPLP